MNRQEIDDLLDRRALDASADDKTTRQMLGVWLRARLSADPGTRAARVRVLLRRRLGIYEDA